MCFGTCRCYDSGGINRESEIEGGQRGRGGGGEVPSASEHQKTKIKSLSERYQVGPG